MRCLQHKSTHRFCLSLYPVTPTVAAVACTHCSTISIALLVLARGRERSSGTRFLCSAPLITNDALNTNGLLTYVLLQLQLALLVGCASLIITLPSNSCRQGHGDISATLVRKCLQPLPLQSPTSNTLVLPARTPHTPLYHGRQTITALLNLCLGRSINVWS